MKEEKYYMSYNTPGLFYKCEKMDEELAFADACYEIIDKNIINWISEQEFKECRAYPNIYSTKYLDDIFPFCIKLVKQDGKYVVVEKRLSTV